MQNQLTNIEVIMKRILGFSLMVILILPVSAFGDGYKSKYVGEEQRKIKSLSPDDINELKKGGGWGLAKAAELNGVPGPAHVLEMEGEIDLTDEQKQKVQKIYDDMKVKAVVLGEQLIRLEEKLNIGFSDKTINQEVLEKSIEEIAQVRAKLRIVHLSTHLQTPNILTNKQIALYNQLRGYSEDPCQSIPEGHNAEMWKKHNGCK